jgi:transcriptional regulator with XRE-family HTH domain
MESRPGVPADTFPVRLRLARIHAGDISIEVAAARCGVKPATWGTWERGVHKPPHFEAMVKAIATGLEVDEVWLRDGGPLAPDPGPLGPRGLATVSDGGSAPSVPKARTRRNSVYNSAPSESMAA